MTEEVFKDKRVDPVEARIYAVPLRQDSVAMLKLENIRELASYRYVIKNENWDEHFGDSIDVVKDLVDKIHALRVVGPLKKEFVVRGLCEIVYSDSTRENVLISQDGYFKYRNSILRDSYIVLRFLRLDCQED